MRIDVCLTPDTIQLFDLKGKIVVVADIFRATSTMVTALNHGVGAVIPVSNVDQCRNLNVENCIKAAERGGQKVAGFEYGNSPFDYMDNGFSGETLVMTTTNGTRAINLSKEADQVLIGSFLNLTDTLNYLQAQQKDVLIFCAGWKGKFSLEDTLYAGAVIDEFYSEETDSDSAFMAMQLYNNALKDGLHQYLKNANHYRRLSGFDSHKDVEFVLRRDELEGVGQLQNNQIVLK